MVGLAEVVGGDLARAAKVLAGFATADITPPLNLDMAGPGPALDRRATGIHNPLMAHAMVLEIGGNKAAAVGCDVVGVTLDLTCKVRTLVDAVTGIPGQHIMVTASHARSRPVIPNWADRGTCNEDYVSRLPQKIAQVVTAPTKNLQSVEVCYGEVPVEVIGENREYLGGPVDKILRVLDSCVEGRPSPWKHKSGFVFPATPRERF